MTDYKRMYLILCSAIDDVIDPLEQFTVSEPYARKLNDALLAAEEIYIESSVCEDEAQ